MFDGNSVAHLGHVEVYSNKIEESYKFFTDIYGLTESGREGGSYYLRAYDDYEFHTLKLTEHHTTGVGHIGYRTSSENALESRVETIQKNGIEGEWAKGDLGHGRAFRFQGPFDHWFELYWETNKYLPPVSEKPVLKNLHQRFHARGCCPRRLDHVNLLAEDVSVFRDFIFTCFGSRVTEQILLDNGRLGGCWFTVNNKSYDLACTEEHGGGRARLHHVTYVTDQRDEIIRAADIFLENNIQIEQGPHKHAIQGTFFLYVFEPAGNRVEIANQGSRLILQPDWEPIIWSETERKKGQAWGLKTAETFHTYGTPPVEKINQRM